MTLPVNLPPAPKPQIPGRPQNVLHTIAGGIGTVLGAPAMAVNALNTGFATATQSIAAVFPSFPAATLGALTMGAPHAHIAHPPSGPPPIPPTPLPPIGPIIAGCCVQVLIGGIPAARCGDIILNPTCCGLPPLGEIKTGSSNVFIGGSRAARVTDITMHCTPVPSGAGARAAGAAAKTAAKTAMTVAMTAIKVAGMAAQGMQIAGDAIEAVEADDSAMAAALGTNAAMMAAQMAADAAAMALAAAMGKDPCVPPGTPGMVTVPMVPTVLIGGFPMPSWMDIAKGLLKAVKGLRARNNKPAKSKPAKNNTCGCK